METKALRVKCHVLKRAQLLWSTDGSDLIFFPLTSFVMKDGSLGVSEPYFLCRYIGENDLREAEWLCELD